VSTLPSAASETTGPATPSAAAAAGRPPRILVVDWLRGVGVVLMIFAHSFDAWAQPAARFGWKWHMVRHLAGIPSRLFLFLVGVSAAIVFESLAARGRTPAQMRSHLLKRGLAVVGLAYLFRLQEHILAGFNGGWPSLFRVDILNCIGVSLIMLALVAVPHEGRPRYARCLLLAALFVGLGPLVGPAHFPSWIPRPLSSYIGGQRPMSWFALFPWGGWSLVGLVMGHLWLRRGRDAAGQARVFALTGLLGAVTVTAVLLVRGYFPNLIPYRSELVQQMGPGSFFFRLGIIALLACAGWLWTRWTRPDRFSPIRQLGQTSLLIYWVHVELCYGFIARPLQRKLSLPATAVAYLTLVGLMLALSIWKTRRGGQLVQRLRQRWLGPRAPAGSVSSAPP
jgi:uncharacterized membrane protein